LSLGAPRRAEAGRPEARRKARRVERSEAPWSRTEIRHRASHGALSTMAPASTKSDLKRLCRRSAVSSLSLKRFGSREWRSGG
jgi:hypothetical protein